MAAKAVLMLGVLRLGATYPPSTLFSLVSVLLRTIFAIDDQGLGRRAYSDAADFQGLLIDNFLSKLPSATASKSAKLGSL